MIEADSRPEQQASLVDRLSDDAYNKFLSRETVTEKIHLKDGGSMEVSVPNTLSRAVKSALDAVGKPIEVIAGELAAQTIYTPEDTTFVTESRYNDWSDLFAQAASSILHHETIQKYPEVADLDAIRQGTG